MTERDGASRAHRFPVVQFVLALVVIAGIVLRILWLDRLAGIHGDEGWYGLLAQRWAAGDVTIPRTPTGNFTGPIQAALVAIGQFILPAQFLTLRVPTLLSSIAAMAMAWHIGRRHFDATTGRLALLLMAILPANIAFARFGWDVSHGGLVALGAVAMALDRRVILTALLFGLALWTHPTNVFIAPLLITIFFASHRKAGTFAVSRRMMALVAAILLFTAVMMLTATHAGDFANPAAILSRLASPSEWVAFVVLLARLLAGRPWFEHMAGSDYGALLPLVDVIGLSLLLGTIWFAVGTLRGWRLSYGGVPAGWLAMLAAYLLVIGAAPLNAGTERYGFVLIAPTALVFALALRTWLRRGAGGLPEAVMTGALGFGLVSATVAYYFVPLATRNDSNVDPFFRTGVIEPKEAAASWLVGQARPGRHLRLVAEDWWLSWPMAYRLSGYPVTVINTQTDPHEAWRATSVRTFDIVYAGSPRDRQLASDSRPSFVATGNDGRAIVRVWERHPPTGD